MFNKLKNKLQGYSDKTIGIFYICTGRYSIFWEKFFLSSEKHFCPGITKKYFVFTDQEIAPKNEHVEIIYQERLGWPFDTLKRFHLFKKIQDKAMKCNYLYFFNANMIFLRDVMPSDIFPTEQEQIVVTRHPFYYEGAKGGPFETNKISAAYIDDSEAKWYVAGGLQGGISKYYYELGDKIIETVDKDLAINHISPWWDESHLNYHIAHRKNYKVLHPGFICPDDRIKSLPFKVYLTVLDKKNFGGHEFMRHVEK